MKPEWRDIDEFEGYSIRDDGEVFNGYTGGRMTHSSFKGSPPSVGLIPEGFRNKQIRRSIPLLVAKAFLPDPPRGDFNTPIQLDGDRSNCRADNLMWRPRWFAIQYHQERRHDPFPKWAKEFEVIETGEMFEHPKHCAVRYGILEDSDFGILHAIMNGNRVFPTSLSFRW